MRFEFCLKLNEAVLRWQRLAGNREELGIGLERVNVEMEGAVAYWASEWEAKSGRARVLVTLESYGNDAEGTRGKRRLPALLAWAKGNSVAASRGRKGLVFRLARKTLNTFWVA